MNFGRKYRIGDLISGAAGVLALAFVARTQAFAESPDQSLAEITVTARFIAPGGQSALKMNVPVRDVPFSLVDYSQSFMKAVDTTQLTDLYGYMSGVQSAGKSGYDISLRGFTVSSTDPTSVMYDGLPGLPARTASPETANLARVEVVKGPASVLYGRAQPGGFINLITKKPSMRPNTSVDLRADTYDGAGVAFGTKNGYTASVDTTGPIDDAGRFLGRAIVEYANAQSFRAFVHDKDVMFAPSLTWNVSDKTRATLLLEYRHGNDSFDQDLVAPNLKSNLIAPITTRYQEPGDSELERGETATLLVHHTFSRALSWDFNARSVFSEDHEIGFDNFKIKPDLVTLERKDRNQDNHHHLNFVDTSLTYLFDTGRVHHRLLAGLTYGETIEDYNRIRFYYSPALNISIYSPVYGAVAPSVEPPQAHSWASGKYFGVYATDLMSFSDHWKGVVGARYDKQDQVSKELRLPSSGPRTGTFSDAFPMGGIIYQPTKQWSIYASYSTSYVPPPPGAKSINPGQTLKAQFAEQEEVGAKFESESGRANATLSLFNIKEQNVIQVVGTTGLYDQIGATRSRGVEAELNLRPTSWWQLTANYALLDPRIIDDATLNRIGSMTMNSPRNSGSVLSRMQLPGRLNAFGWMLGVIYRSERVGNLPTATDPGDLVLPGYTTVDTGVNYSRGTVNVSFKLSNVFDRGYYLSAFSNTRVVPGTPRQFSLDLNKRFD